MSSSLVIACNIIRFTEAVLISCSPLPGVWSVGRVERHKASFPTQPGEIAHGGREGDLPCWDCCVPSGSRVHAGPIQDLRIKGGY